MPVLAIHSRGAIARFLIIAIAVLAADLAIKSWSFARVADQPVQYPADRPLTRIDIPDHDAISLVPSILALKLVANEGAVFGIGQGRRWVFVGVSLVALGVIVWMFARSSARAIVFHTVLALVLAGALGNLHDRLLIGSVRDMFWLFPGVSLPWGWRWPDGSTEAYPWIFNVADAALVIGLLTLATISVFGVRRDKSQSRA